ncbi:translin [Cinnamomum micranthum f. kanehirae]|uniref:Translin n=1 Tax=Cinnamomum micranthum f. kanehirae TaxID=337451 RepID=A0A443N347_9MAGN|nr:translin [Cinnamomum micranthum f. kanehirae]
MKRFLLSISHPPNQCPKSLCPHNTNNTLFPAIPFPLTSNSNHHSSLVTCLRSVSFTFSLSPAMSNITRASSSSSPPPPPPPPLSIQNQFGDFHKQLEDSGVIRERIQSVVREMEHAIRLMQSSIILIHQSLPASEVLEKSRVQIDKLRELYKRLCEILSECPGQYYRWEYLGSWLQFFFTAFVFILARYHGDWKTETQTVVSLLAFLHWLETGNLLIHKEAEEKLGLDSSEFGLDIEDYLIGLCFMSNELPRYVVNQVISGDYDCPREALKFLKDLHSSFLVLNLRNDFLRRKFDGMKYDLKRLEEIDYDVNIRGLSAKKPKQDPDAEA